jgi:hypothetical protein
MTEWSLVGLGSGWFALPLSTTQSPLGSLTRQYLHERALLAQRGRYKPVYNM